MVCVLLWGDRMKRVLRAVWPYVRTLMLVFVLGLIAFFILSNAMSIGKLRAGLTEANDKLQAAGLAPVEVEGEPGAQGPQGDPGRAPTAAEIALAVQNYCSINDCTGADGRDGPAPSTEQVADAVEAYCAANNDCQGPTGEAGADGQDGQDGKSITGPAGPAGPRGEQGQPGKDGQSAFPFSFTFTVNETTITCQVDSPTETTCTPLEPEGSETETP